MSDNFEPSYLWWLFLIFIHEIKNNNMFMLLLLFQITETLVQFIYNKLTLNNI
jgi:hypothetical protein